MIKKILGLALIIIGLAVIFYSLYSSFNIFSGKETAPEMFKETKQNISQGEGMEEMIAQQLKGLIPTGSITIFFNLISWSVFAGILIFGGTQVAGLGIKLLN